MFTDRKNVPFRDFSTPPPSQRSSRSMSWRSAPSTPFQPWEKKKSSPRPLPPPRTPDSLHVLYKVPTGDSPYVKAKQVQLIDKDPSKSISLFWSAINAGDRVDSALKDMAIVMKQMNRTDEAIEAIKSFRHLCSHQAQESLDNVLIDLYKRGGRMEEHIELLQYKLRLIEDGVAFNGKRTKIARSQGKKFHVSVEQEKARLLGNLAWAFMQQNNYKTAEELYRKALLLEPDKNKQCNLSICLLNSGKLIEARSLLDAVRPTPAERETADSYIKSFDRAVETLSELEEQSVQNPQSKLSSLDDGDQGETLAFPLCRKWEDKNKEVTKESCNYSFLKEVRGSYSKDQREYNADPSGISKKGRWAVEQRSCFQLAQDPLTADKLHRKVRCSQNLFEETFGFSCLKNENLGGEIRTKGDGISSKNTSISDLNMFKSPVHFCRHSQLQSTESSQDWQSGTSWGDKKKADFHACVKTDLESPRAVNKSGTTEKEKLGGGLQAISSQGWDQRLLGSVNPNVGQDTREVSHRVRNDIIGGGNFKINKGFYFKSGKSWADMVEEEEEILRECTDTSMNRCDYLSQESPASLQTPSKWVKQWHEDREAFYDDENMNSNIMDPSPPRPPSSLRLTSQAHPSPQKDFGEELAQKLQLVAVKDGQRYKKSTENSLERSSTSRRVLSFNQLERKGVHADSCSSPFPPKVFECNRVPKLGSNDSEPLGRGNRRLQVFKDITLLDTPRA